MRIVDGGLLRAGHEKRKTREAAIAATASCIDTLERSKPAPGAGVRSLERFGCPELSSGTKGESCQHEKRKAREAAIAATASCFDTLERYKPAPGAGVRSLERFGCPELSSGTKGES